MHFSRQLDASKRLGPRKAELALVAGEAGNEFIERKGSSDGKGGICEYGRGK